MTTTTERATGFDLTLTEEQELTQGEMKQQSPGVVRGGRVGTFT